MKIAVIPVFLDNKLLFKINAFLVIVRCLKETADKFFGGQLGAKASCTQQGSLE